MITLNDALIELVDGKQVEPKEAYAQGDRQGRLRDGARPRGHDMSFSSSTPTRRVSAAASARPASRPGQAPGRAALGTAPMPPAASRSARAKGVRAQGSLLRSAARPWSGSPQAEATHGCCSVRAPAAPPRPRVRRRWRRSRSSPGGLVFLAVAVAVAAEDLSAAHVVRAVTATEGIILRRMLRRCSSIGTPPSLDG